MALPDDVGFLLGNDSGRFVSLSVQAHYNNPDEVEGLIDNSGVRVYYTEELRPIDMGVIQLGDPFVLLDGTAVPDGKSSYSFQCPSSCFEEHFEVRNQLLCDRGYYCRLSLLYGVNTRNVDSFTGSDPIPWPYK